MAKFNYSEIPSGTIRLLQLLPCKAGPRIARCKFLEVALQETNTPRPYEALSYCWGSEKLTRSIIIIDDQGEDRKLRVTENLYAALPHLQDRDIHRTIWVDAICIDQANFKEKEAQIQLMPEIYAKASRVVVWLGGSQNGSDGALIEIRDAAEKSLSPERTPQPLTAAIMALLQNPWFGRIWVLQEVAAARQVLIMHGSSEIDGHAFCLGLRFFENAMDQVAFLIRGAIFRSRHIMKETGRPFSLKVASLGELLDMYHGHQATKPLDMIYALLGMSLEFGKEPLAALMPDYKLEWKTLMQRLIQFFFNGQASIEAWSGRKTPLIKVRGRALARVTAVDTAVATNLEHRQKIEVVFQKKSVGPDTKLAELWESRTLANQIQKGDIICLFEGSSQPAIVRPCEDFWAIVAIAAVPQKGGQWSELVRSPLRMFIFLLVWNFKGFSEDPGDLGTSGVWIQAPSAQPNNRMTVLGQMEQGIRIWNVMQALGDVGAIEEAEERRQPATEIFKAVIRNGHRHSLECPCTRIPLSCASEIGDVAVIDLILAASDADIIWESYSGHTALQRAAGSGQEAVVKLLLGTGQVKDYLGVALNEAAESGHEAMVKLLLDTGQIHMASWGYVGSVGSALTKAAKGGHEATVRLLLSTSRSQNHHISDALLQAADRGHEDIVKLLLDTGQVEDWALGD